ncbi:hypothetical protein LTR49_028866, partial [Elasticomyces elasticus]
QGIIKNKYQNMIVLASWTCSQLEGNILAELPLPSSDIHALEQLLLLLNKTLEDEMYSGFDVNAGDEDKETLLTYTSQLFLRTRLDKGHQQLYGSGYL